MSTRGKAQDSKTIEVFLRIRPLVGREIDEGDTANNMRVDPTDSTKITVTQPGRSAVGPRNYNFHQVFDKNSTQQQVYERFAEKAVSSALDGYHGVLFVYGQTGSGKSHTISNNVPGNEGVLQRCVRDVFARIADDTAHEYACSVSYVQLYNEILTDLLEDASVQNNHVKLVGVSDINGDLSLVSDRTGEKIGQRVANEAEALELYELGSSRKEMAKTKMNDTSSRSHCIYTLEISRRPRATAGGGAAAAAAAAGSGGGPRALEGKLILCDLAGSERVAKTGARDRQLTEATHINSSLLVLGKVVSALTDRNAQHVPFRESKLTRLLQYSLSGYGRTSLVVNVSPSDYNTEETVSAIGFGQRAIQIKEKAQQHIILDYKALYLQMQAQLDKQLETAVEEALSDERREHQLEVRDLKARIRELEQERDLLRGGGGAAGSSTGGAGSSTQQQVDALRATHEANLRSVTEERDAFRAEVSDLKHRLSSEQSKLFAVARRFETSRLVTSVKQQAWLAKMNELAAEVAALKQCDFLAIENIDDALDINAAVMQQAAAAAEHSHAGGGAASSGNRGGGGDGGVVDEEQLERAYAVIGALQQERQQMIMYTHKAKTAIRMLFYELQDAKRSVSGS